MLACCCTGLSRLPCQHAGTWPARGADTVANQVQLQSVPDTAGAWYTTLPFAQFDPALGTLNNINVGLAGDLSGSVSIENLQPDPADVSITLSGTLDLGSPGGGILESALPVASASVGLGGNAGASGYAAPSGTVVAMSAAATNQAALAPLSSFIGYGSVGLSVSGEAYLYATGPANMQLQSGAAVGAATTLAYDYTPAQTGSGSEYDGDGFLYVADDGNANPIPVGEIDFANGPLVTAVSPVQTFNFADRTAGWSNDVDARQFDPALGTLMAVNLSVATDILASVSAANLDPISQAVTTTQTTYATLSIPLSNDVASGPIVVPVSATVDDTLALGGYTGSTSFQGASGHTDDALTGVGAARTTLTGNELAAFMGQGTVDLPIATNGTATISGPANLLLSMLADAGASVSLSFTYIPDQPAAGELLFDQPGSYDIAGGAPGSTVGTGSTISSTQTVQSVLIDSPGATVVLDGPLDVTGGFTLDAGTLVIADGALAVGSWLQSGGEVSGSDVTIVATGSIGISAGSIVAGTVDLVAAGSMDLSGGAIVAGRVNLDSPSAGTGTLGAVSTTGISILDDQTAPPVITVAASGPPSIYAGGTADFTASTIAAIRLDPGVQVDAGEAPVILTGTVSITHGFIAGDMLNVGTTEGGIITSYNPAAGVLTLTGPATLADYQDTLASITYSFAGDPTAGGTDDSRSISWMVNDGTAASAGADSRLAVSFPDEPLNDLMFQNQDGQVALWQVNGSTISADALLGPNPGPTWTMVDADPLSSGSGSDILWQNQDGQVAVWQTQATTLLTARAVGPNPGPTWHIRATGTFYNDGNTNLVWQNDDGQVALWDINNTTLLQAAAVAADPGPTWHVEGTGDFYRDGNTAIVFQNDNGQVALWDMNGTTIAACGVVSANPGSAWTIKGTGDFYGDGNTDILWQNAGGAVAVWDMNGTTVQASTVIADPGPAWHIVGTGDYDSNGMTDIVFQSDGGQVAIWEMNHATIAAAALLANPGTAWSVVDNSMRFIYSAAANEILTAAPATPEEFVFTSYAAGTHTIAGFNPAQDMIELLNAQFASYADVQAAMSLVPGAVAINLGGGSSLLLPGVDPAVLHAGNFVLT